MSWRATSFAALATLAGCGLLSEPIPPGPENRCGSDDDCGADRCDVELGMCVARSPDAYRYYLEVITPADPVSGTSASRTFGPFDADATLPPEGVVLTLPDPARVDGTVRWGTELVSAQVTFTPRGRALVSDPNRFRTVTIDRESPDWREDRDFELELDPALPGEPALVYDLLVEPTGDFRALLPPLRSTIEVRDAGQHVAILYDDAMLMTVVGDLHDTEGLPMSGLTVRAFDPETGARVSSVATLTDAADVPGEFRLTMWANAASSGWQLRIVADADRLYPTYVVDPGVLTTIEDPTTHERRAQVLVPDAMIPVTYQGTVEYPEDLGDARPVPGAILTLRSDALVDETTGMVGSIETRLVADERGVFDGLVLPGDYEVTVVPAEAPELGVLVEERTLAPPATGTAIVGHLYRAPARTILGGMAQAPGGEPLTGARVSAAALGIPLEGIPFPEIARRNRSSDGTVGSMGEFRLALDVGVYDLVVEPSERSGYPWWVDADVGIGGGMAPPRIYEVRAPVVFVATVVDAASVPIEGAEIRAYGELASGRLVSIGRTATADLGELRILLPPVLER